MISIENAIDIFKKNMPNNIITTIGDWKSKYVFGSRDKSLKDGDPNWDSTVGAVDKITGKFSKMDAFDDDLNRNVKIIKRNLRL